MIIDFIKTDLLIGLERKKKQQIYANKNPHVVIRFNS